MSTFRYKVGDRVWLVYEGEIFENNRHLPSEIVSVESGRITKAFERQLTNYYLVTSTGVSEEKVEEKDIIPYEDTKRLSLKIAELHHIIDIRKANLAAMQKKKQLELDFER